MCNGNFCGFSMNERICLFDKFGLFIFYFFKIYFYNLYFYKVGKLDGIKMKCNVWDWLIVLYFFEIWRYIEKK